MPFSRREFLVRLGAGGAGLTLAPALTSRGLEASRTPVAQGAVGMPLRLDSNENPNGPSPAALEAIRRSLTEASRYPDLPEDQLRNAIARFHDVTPEMVLLGCGSTEILRVAVMAFCRAGHPLVSAAPTFEEPVRMAKTLGAPVVEVPVDSGLRLDLDAMARAGAPSAGLIFCCNPNNPTATVHGDAAIRRFVASARAASPAAAILLDEAYHEYVEDSAYASAIPMLRSEPRVIVCRTLSKVHGLAGIRVGYALASAETIAAMRPWRLSSGINVAASAGAIASLDGRAHVTLEQQRNREAKAFTRRVFEDLGYRVGPSETNFLMVDIRRDAREFKAACLTRGIAVGRQFPPFLQHARISIGTLNEMQRAAQVFRALLAAA